MPEDYTFEDLRRDWHEAGLRTGRLICDLAHHFHYEDGDRFYPMYRSCLVIPERQSDPENPKVVAYHDPAWLGKERKMENLPDFRQIIEFSGQRHGVDIFINGEECGE